MKNTYIESLIKKYGILTGAHRGTHGGNVIQNTCLAYEMSLLHGAQVVECDIIMTTDGKFYAFHNGHEKDCLGIDTDIRKMTSKEVDSFICLNELGQSSNQKLERLELVLHRLKDRCIINIDRSWFYWQETLDFLKDFEMNEQILLKSPVEDVLLKTLEKSGSKISYMPILKEKSELDKVFSYNVNFAAAELCFADANSPLVSAETMKMLRNRGVFTWVNAINIGSNYILSAQYDDEVSLRENAEKGWGKLIDMGFDIIQTDWPYLLSSYIKSRNA